MRQFSEILLSEPGFTGLGERFQSSIEKYPLFQFFLL